MSPKIEDLEQQISDLKLALSNFSWNTIRVESAQDAYIERLEAAFLVVKEELEWEGRDGDMGRAECKQEALNALEEIRRGA